MADLSLYLITSSKNLPRGATVESVVKEAIRGGVTIVQLREKELSTQLFLKRAQSLRKICQEPVKLIISDRIDIALACGADGVHLGQEDMPIRFARKLLGDKAIIGVSVSTPGEARSAVEQGATYLGVGTCWPSNTKASPDSKVIGPRGMKAIRDELVRLGKYTPLVAIGGINSNNLIRTLYGCISSQIYNPRKTEAAVGVAVVSAIMSSKDPFLETRRLKGLIHEFHNWLKTPRRPGDYHRKPSFDTGFSTLLSQLMTNTSTPLIHHITNTVVQTDCANLTLAYGCSPIMSSDVNEVEELVVLQNGSLVLNLGTFTDDQFHAMKLAGRKANLIGKPIIFDPVGVGASQERANKANELLNHVQVSVIKGNQAEIATLAKLKNAGVSSRGVDSQGQVEEPDKLVQQLARQERNLYCGHDRSKRLGIRWQGCI